MKNKIPAVIVLFALFGFNLCYAEKPTVMREYITRKSGGVRSEEERVNVRYEGLRIERGDYFTVSFLDEEGNVLKESEIGFSDLSLKEDEMKISSRELTDARYVYIEVIGADGDSKGIKLPFKIQK